MNAALDKAREEFCQAVRDCAEKARESTREGLLSQSKERDEPPAAEPNAPGNSRDAEQAKEIHQMEQQLPRRCAGSRQLSAASSVCRATAARLWWSPCTPCLTASCRSVRSPRCSSQPPAKSDAPAPPAEPRPLRHPDGPPGGRPGMDMRSPGMTGPGAGPGPLRDECRLRDLEDKMDRLLKELESLKGEKKDKDKEKKNSEENESSHKARPDSHGRRMTSSAHRFLMRSRGFEAPWPCSRMAMEPELHQTDRARRAVAR